MRRGGEKSAEGRDEFLKGGEKEAVFSGGDKRGGSGVRGHSDDGSGGGRHGFDKDDAEALLFGGKDKDGGGKVGLADDVVRGMGIVNAEAVGDAESPGFVKKDAFFGAVANQGDSEVGEFGEKGCSGVEEHVEALVRDEAADVENRMGWAGKVGIEESGVNATGDDRNRSAKAGGGELGDG